MISGGWSAHAAVAAVNIPPRIAADRKKARADRNRNEHPRPVHGGPDSLDCLVILSAPFGLTIRLSRLSSPTLPTLTPSASGPGMFRNQQRETQRLWRNLDLRRQGAQHLAVRLYINHLVGAVVHITLRGNRFHQIDPRSKTVPLGQHRHQEPEVAEPAAGLEGHQPKFAV